MKDTKDVTACVVDHGLFSPLAQKLGQTFKRVLYYSPWEEGFPQLNRCIVGDGYPEIERCDDFWDELADIDLFIFPDIQHSGLQLHLESIGKAVWGSRKGDSLELSREKFHRTLKQLDLDCPKWVSITGLSKLRDHLREHEDRYVKISKYRGLMETWHHATYRQSEPMLDMLAVKLGPAKEHIPFIVVEPVATDLEIGYDGYCIDGQFPSIAIGGGVEIKDSGYLCGIMDASAMPEQITEINDAFGPILGEYRYRNFFSTEIRVKDDKRFFIDPCCRCPSPATEAQIELYGNLADIVWAGANGECIDPEPTALFAAECVLRAKRTAQQWCVLDVPAKARPWTKFGGSCFIDDQVCIPPCEDGPEVGWIVGTGDSIQDAIDALKKHVEELGDCPVSADVDALYDAVKEFHEADEKGVPLTDSEVPEPETVLE